MCYMAYFEESCRAKWSAKYYLSLQKMSLEDKNTETLEVITKLIGKLSTKTIPSWDISEKGHSIKNHIRRFENAIQPDMDEVEKAREFSATMRGSAAVYVEELTDDTKNNYTKLKNELLSTFHKEKSVNALMKEFKSLKWRKNRQSIREFAAILNMKWRKITSAANDQGEKGDNCSQAILKNRLLEALKEADPKFGASLEFFLTDSSSTLKELAAQAELKYDLYIENEERISESSYDNDIMLYNSEFQTKQSKRKKNKDHLNQWLQNQNKNSGFPGFKQKYVHDLKQKDYGLDYGPRYGPDYGPKYGSDYGPEYESDYGPDYEPNYEPNYGPDYESDYGPFGPEMTDSENFRGDQEISFGEYNQQSEFLGPHRKKRKMDYEGKTDLENDFEQHYMSKKPRLNQQEIYTKNSENYKFSERDSSDQSESTEYL